MATLNDIQKLTGLSKSTISRVINRDASLSVSEKTRAHIIEVANQLNYLPPKEKRKRCERSDTIPVRSHYQNHAENARSLVVIHFLDSDLECLDPYFTLIRIGIAQRCDTLKISPNHLYTNTVQFNHNVIKNADAVICVGHFSTLQINEICNLSSKLIFIDSSPMGLKSDSVLFDREHAAQEIVGSILQSGYQRPAFIGNDETRLHVFRRMTQQAGSYNHNYCVVTKEFNVEQGYLAMIKLLKLHPRPDIVFAATDIIAIGVYRAILEVGAKIPNDIAVVGMNDIPMAAELSPPLSTVWLPAKEMGEAAVDLFVEKLNGREYNKCVTLGHDIRWRESYIPSSL